MNYIKVYNKLIKKAKEKNRVKLNKDDINYVYYEKHHIIPKCLDGNNNKDNLVLLTGKEHFIAHKLLIKIHPGNRKLIDAFFFMIHGNQKQHYNASARDYEQSVKLKNLTPFSEETLQKMRKHLKQLHKKNIGEVPWNKGLEAINKGVPMKEESKLKMKETLKHKYETGWKPRVGHTHSDESKEKISNANKGHKRWEGKKHSEESKQKMSASHKGEIPWNKGKTASDETKEKMRHAKLGKPSPNKGRKFYIDENGKKRMIKRI